MADCITTDNFTLSAIDATETVPDRPAGISYYVKVDAATPSITIEFTNCTSVSVTPTTDQPQPSTTKVKFTTADIGTTFELTFGWPQEYLEPGGPIEDPTMHPKFKPQGSCPP